MASLSPARVGFFVLLLTLPSCITARHRSVLALSRSSSVEQAAAAWQRIASVGPEAASLVKYDEAVAATVRQLAARQAPAAWPATLKTEDGWTVRIDAGSRSRRDVWQPRLLDKLEAKKSNKACPVPTAVRVGLGTTLVGVRDHDAADADAEFVFSKGQQLPVTAVLDFKPDAAHSREATLHLYDPREVKSVRVGQRSIALAADLASPAHDALDKRSFLFDTFAGLLRPGRFSEEQGLYALEPYREGKIPIVLVHGLMSNPHIWETLVVALMSDPELGPRVQCWCFMYPTGLPLPSSAARLRSGLKQASEKLEQRKPGHAPADLLLVGHSMGGLLSRMQVIDSGEAFWRTWFTKSPGKIALDTEAETVMRDTLLFKANPAVKGVVFIATPHHGVKLAEGWLGRLGSKLIRTPLQLVQVLTSIATLDIEAINPARLGMNKLGTDSINGLATKHPVIAAINSRPLRAPAYSIIAVEEDKPTPEETTDGYVPYISSHLDGVKNEVLVKAGHRCTAKLETVQAVLAALRSQLKR